MPPNNPYIEKVKNDTDIFHVPEEAYCHKWKWWEYFGNTHPLVLEIGTGMGNFFSKQVGEYPEKNFLGMEIRYKRCFQTAEKSRKSQQLQPLSFRMKGEDSGVDYEKWKEIGRGSNKNFVILKDFAQNIDKIFSPEEVSETYIFFPDPWANKDRQRKHRLLQEEFLKNLYEITKTWGNFFFKTDHREYFDSTKEILEKQWLWNIQNWTHDYENSEIFDIGNITEFEWFYRGEKTDINYIELVK